MTDLEYQEVLSATYGRPIKILSYEGTAEEVEHAKHVAIEATNGLWLFEDETSDDDGDYDERVTASKGCFVSLKRSSEVV